MVFLAERSESFLWSKILRLSENDRGKRCDYWDFTAWFSDDKRLCKLNQFIGKITWKFYL